MDNSASPPQVYLEIVGECDVMLWSLSSELRHQRIFARLGITPLAARGIDEEISIVMVRADFLLGNDLAAALAERHNIVLTNDARDQAIAAHVAPQRRDWAKNLLSDPPADGCLGATVPDDIAVTYPLELGTRYDALLRKRATPVALSYFDTPIEVLEQKTFGAAYKGATDFVTKWIWPRPAKWATRWAAARGISPNTVTTASLVLVFATIYLFAHGHFLTALLVAWMMTFLDTVDGKLARVTVASSAWGNIYDHGIDLVHPPFWWWACYVGLLPMANAEIAPLLLPALWVILAGYVVGRIFEGLFVLAFKIETHIWRPIDYYFRTITARRNPNLAVLTIATLLGRPDIGFVGIALWTIISLVFHAVRLMQATVLRLKGHTVDSWLVDADA